MPVDEVQIIRIRELSQKYLFLLQKNTKGHNSVLNSILRSFLYTSVREEWIKDMNRDE